ncbi:YqhA family protein [Candidatus Zinderia endosymbiont of Aphrophora alni]|uniref:YqhA family protein n=1 Tax=Candidatus Zinderia endosymbiont of Aphrophora alni TaxID=3077951 RepID=UPI0030CD5799
MFFLNFKKINFIKKRIDILPNFIFMSRWLQLPLYIGLIISQCIYVYYFWIELFDLIKASFGNIKSLRHIASLVSTSENLLNFKYLNEQTIMLVILSLIDIVMISNLLIMVIIGGYETFISRMKLENHPDQPGWLSNVNASVLKIKLATAIIGISSINLLKTFINANVCELKTLIFQTFIHLVFLLSAISIAYCDKLSYNYILNISKNK